MKNNIFLLIMFCCFSFTLVAQTDAYQDYPTKADWERIWSKDDPSVHQDVMNAMEIPADVLSKMSTEGLLETCLMYPANTWALTDPTGNYQRSYRYYVDRSNAYNAFFKRKNGVAAAIKMYREYDYKSGNEYLDLAGTEEFRTYHSQAIFLGLMLGQKEMVEKMTPEQRKEVIQIGLSKAQAVTTSELFGGPSQGFIFYSLISIMDSERYSGLEALKSKSETIATYVSDAKVFTRQDLQNVLRVANEFVNK